MTKEVSIPEISVQVVMRRGSERDETHENEMRVDYASRSTSVRPPLALCVARPLWTLSSTLHAELYVTRIDLDEQLAAGENQWLNDCQA